MSTTINLKNLNTRTYGTVDKLRVALEKGRDTLRRIIANADFRDDREIAAHTVELTRALEAANDQLFSVAMNLENTPDFKVTSAAVDSIQRHIEDMQFETDCLNTLMDELEAA